MTCAFCGTDVSRFAAVRHAGRWLHRNCRKDLLRVMAGEKLAQLRKQKEAAK